ncbi:MAG: fluoride efflux transporter CrcB [Candidatus Binatia bacterium]
MKNTFLVGLGGFIGSALRYLIEGWVHALVDKPWFPYGTLAVNSLGCLLIGFLAGLSEIRQVFGPEVRLFLFLGILGGFTTFSSFAYETFSFGRNAQILTASMNVALQLILGFTGVWLGHVLSRLM